MESSTHKSQGISTVDIVSIESHTLEDVGHCVCNVLVDKEDDEPNSSEHCAQAQGLDHTGTGRERKEEKEEEGRRAEIRRQSNNGKGK